MAYLISDHTGNIEIADEERDISTSLVLSGRHYSDWGETYAQNFLSLLSNFASRSSERPSTPRIGQLWYDADGKDISVYRGGGEWYVVGSAPAKLANARQITLAGAVTGSAAFDGSQNITIQTTPEVVQSLTPGTYASADITVDRYGRVVAATNGVGGEAGTTEVESVRFINPSNQAGPTKIGAVAITKADIEHALGFSPYPASNPNNYAPAAGSVDLAPYFLHNGSRAMTGSLNMGAKEIVNMAAPQASTSGARKADIDALAAQKTLRKFQGQNDTEYSVTVSTAAPTGGVDGDVWYRY